MFKYHTHATVILKNVAKFLGKHLRWSPLYTVNVAKNFPNASSVEHQFSNNFYCLTAYSQCVYFRIPGKN